jgi:nitronate monooxygenase
MPSKLRAAYPWAASPLIINAPMGGFAGGALATAVSDAGGIGLIGAVDETEKIEVYLAEASTYFSSSGASPSSSSVSCKNESAAQFFAETHLLPLGVGFITFFVDMEAALKVLQAHPPAIVWLFAAKEFADYGVWAEALRKVVPATKIWIQVGSASAALEIARLARPDVLVLQGADAGGHGFRRGAGIVSLLPETRDLLASHGLADNVSLVAAGGVVDGRGVAAALTLGAEGVVMGTRFLVAPETKIHDAYRDAVLKARDGAASTVRADVFDKLRGPNIWPAVYDGRALTTDSYADWQDGVDIDEIRKRCKEAAGGEDKGYTRRAAVWAGTGVGLVNEVRPAAEIVEDVRESAKRVLREAVDSI